VGGEPLDVFDAGPIEADLMSDRLAGAVDLGLFELDVIELDEDPRDSNFFFRELKVLLKIDGEVTESEEDVVAGAGASEAPWEPLRGLPCEGGVTELVFVLALVLSWAGVSLEDELAAELDGFVDFFRVDGAAAAEGRLLEEEEVVVAWLAERLSVEPNKLLKNFAAP